MEKNSMLESNVEVYPKELDFLVNYLVGIVDRKGQLKYWCQWGIYEDWLSLGDVIDYFKDVVRHRQTNLNKEQIKAVLLVNVRWSKFNRITDEEEVPKNWLKQGFYYIRHPYWPKIEDQARRALELLKIKQDGNFERRIEGNDIYDPKITDHYPMDIYSLVDCLLKIVDRESQLEHWRGYYGYDESVISFDIQVEWFKENLRRQKIHFTEVQIRSILRVKAMHYRFSRMICENEESLPTDAVEKSTYMVDHPYWVKIQEQARHALSLIKIK